jgi:hypothetical protein
MTKLRSRILQFLTIGVVTAVTIYWSQKPLSAPLQDGIANRIASILSGYLVLVTLIERATEVVVGIFRTLNKEFEEELDSIEKTLGSKDTVEYREKFNEYIGYRAGTQQLSLLVGFTMSVFLCATGVGILGSILNVPYPGEQQKQFIRAVDIVLTSGLLAGGSKAFHEIVANSIKDAVDGIKKPG